MYYLKKKHRTDIPPGGWDSQKHFEKKTVEGLWDIDYKDPLVVPLPRIHRRDYTPQRFFEEFQLRQTPVIIEGCMDDWAAMDSSSSSEWTAEKLEPRFRHLQFKCGEDDDGRRLRTKMKYFADYMKHQQDDSPLYLFQSAFHEDAQTCTLLKDFKVPDVFSQDFLNLVGMDKKPPWRWWCIGPERSGTTMHKDPLGTSAWNAVTHGYKRWLCIEPQIDVKLVKSKNMREPGEDDEAIDYFKNILPRLKERVRREQLPVRFYEGIQKPGDVIYVPGQWWHGVVNLKDAVAVTQNFCGYAEFDRVFNCIRKQRPILAQRLRRAMRLHRPELYQRALYLEDTDPNASDATSSSSSSTSSSSSDDDEDINFVGCRDKDCEGLTPPWARQRKMDVETD